MKKNIKKRSWIVFIALLVLMFVYVGGASGAEILKLGHLNAFSGGASLYGADSKRAITMAVEEINSSGGISIAGKTYQIEVIHLDTKYNAAETVAGYRRLVDLHKIRVIHNMGTVTGQAIMLYNQKEKVLLDIISPTESMNQQGNTLLLNQVCRPNGFSRPVAKEAAREGLKSMCIIADDSIFGREHAAIITKNFEELGGKIIASEYVDAPKGVDFMAELTKLKGYNPDCLFIVAMEEPGARIAKQAREAGIKTRLLFTEHFKKKIIDVVGIENLEGTLFCGTPLTLMASPIEGTPKEYLDFREKYLKRWPGTTLSATGAYGYNWIYYTLKAMHLAGTVEDVDAIRAKASEAIAQSKLITYQGFTKGGRGYGQPTYVMGVKNGKIFVLSEEPYPKSLAELGEK
ncbi:MAG TPA: ABC transporter substrate-binding protein [Desulfobacterales bacterium]|nr:ABC transporter substrate-binding protein [Desulfobacterales bacterium]